MLYLHNDILLTDVIGYDWLTTTTTVLRPFFRDHPGEPVPEENFWTLWCKGGLPEADTQTIRLHGRHSIQTNQCPRPPSPIFLQAGYPSCGPTNSVEALPPKLNPGHGTGQFVWKAREAGCLLQSKVALDIRSASWASSELFSVCEGLTAGKRNTMSSSLERRVISVWRLLIESVVDVGDDVTDH